MVDYFCSGETHLSILAGEMSLRHLGMFRGGGGVRVLLLDVSLKLEIIDFLQPRIKQKL